MGSLICLDVYRYQKHVLIPRSFTTHIQENVKEGIQKVFSDPQFAIKVLVLCKCSTVNGIENYML